MSPLPEKMDKPKAKFKSKKKGCKHLPVKSDPISAILSKMDSKMDLLDPKMDGVKKDIKANKDNLIEELDTIKTEIATLNMIKFSMESTAEEDYSEIAFNHDGSGYLVHSLL